MSYEYIKKNTVTPSLYMQQPGISPVSAINWNKLEDAKDLEVWNRLCANFWLPEKVPLANDTAAWNNKMTAEEREITMRVFTGLTVLDTIQGEVGEMLQASHAQTQHESAIYTNIAFMQNVHAKSYSSVFSTLCSSKEIEEAYTWAAQDELLQERARIILDLYKEDDPILHKIGSVMISSFLLYAGFYLPLHLSVHATLTNTADMVRLILRDKAIHGYYGGYKYQRLIENLPEDKREFYKQLTYETLEKLYALEMEYSKQFFEPLGLMHEAAQFIRYNANKALMNMGYSDLMFTAEETEISSEIAAALSPGSEENHDFFSGSGSSYIIGTSEETTDDDWEF